MSGVFAQKSCQNNCHGHGHRKRCEIRGVKVVQYASAIDQHQKLSLKHLSWVARGEGMRPWAACMIPKGPKYPYGEYLPKP